MNNINKVKIIQHNVLKWTHARRCELSNHYAKENADIILLNSTGIPDSDRIKIFNYSVYQRNIHGEESAGVAVCVKKTIKHKILDDFYGDMLGINLETSRGPVTIITTYLPPRRNDIPLAELRRELQKNQAVYIFGDLNAKHQTLGNTRTNNNGQEIANLIRNDICSFRGPDFNTLIRRAGTGHPDIILGNRNALFYSRIYEGNISTSDHIPVVLELSTKPIMIPVTPRLNMKKTNWENFQSLVREEMIVNEQNMRNTEIINKEKIDEHINKWMTTIQTGIKATTPMQSFRLQPNVKESDELRLIELTYNRLRFNTDSWTLGQIDEIRSLQQRMRTEMSSLSNKFWEDKIENLQDIYNRPEKFWKEVQLLKGSNHIEPPYLVNTRNEKVFEVDGKLELHRENWQEVFQISPEENAQYNQAHEARINEHLREYNNELRTYADADLSRLNEEDLMTKPVTTEDVKRIIKSFKNKAPGKSGISRVILINLPEEAYINYTTIINYTISMGYFPIMFKEGIIILILKPGKDPTKPGSYRPITLLEIPGKILERIINERIQGYAETNNKYHPNQYGFRKGRGTEMALMKIYEKVALNQREKGQCNLICRDIEKAFDKVWHNGLKFKISNLGLPSILVRMTSSFLDDRTAKIKYKDKLSDNINIRSGVPQGSILSPTLFILYTADLPRAGQGGTDVLFADDVTQVIEYNHQSKKMLAIRTKREIERINKYEEQWKIKTSRQKFKMLSVSKTKPEKIEINNEEIPFTDSITVLGLKITRTGLVKHLHDRMNKAKTELAKLYRFVKLSPKIKSHLYKTLILPILEYPAVHCCLASKTNLEKMQRIQNKAIRFINKHSGDELSIEETHERYRLEPINTRLFKRANKSWDKLNLLEPGLVEHSRMENETEDRTDHYWWRRIASFVEGPQPDPFYA